MDHGYAVRVEWQGNLGTGTSGYRDYGRDLLISAEGNPPIEGSADTPFRGTPERWNPEELLLAALAQCHMLSYLHVAVVNGIVVTDYEDDAVGTMEQVGEGALLHRRLRQLPRAARARDSRRMRRAAALVAAVGLLVGLQVASPASA